MASLINVMAASFTFFGFSEVVQKIWDFYLWKLWSYYELPQAKNGMLFSLKVYIQLQK